MSVPTGKRSADMNRFSVLRNSLAAHTGDAGIMMLRNGATAAVGARFWIGLRSAFLACSLTDFGGTVGALWVYKE
ncbi:MAG: hypothetical protein M3N50_01085, partial [Pseudomonadota bacterium]|nr:hypothetical protein [Pseudomonadota bacterium]